MTDRSKKAAKKAARKAKPGAAEAGVKSAQGVFAKILNKADPKK
ncbi:MAG: hypothetical protein OJI67_20845 [Prosthecobacter sp.]|nr:hypothetical protein [Prosthecobacter sp.]